MPLAGLSLPVGPTKLGRSALAHGEVHVQKILVIALNDCDNENPFQQDRGLGNGMIFEVSSEELRAKVQRRLVEIFRAFEESELYRLDDESIRWEEAVAGELSLTLKYIDLESDEEREFTHSFSQGG